MQALWQGIDAFAIPRSNAAEPRDLYGTVRGQPGRPADAPAQGFVFFGPTTIYGDAVAGDKIVNGDDSDE